MRAENDQRSVYDLYARGWSMLAGGHPHQAAMLLSRAKLLEPEKASIREALGPGPVRERPRFARRASSRRPCS